MTSFKNSGWLLWAASLALSPSLAAEAVAGGTTDSVTASTRKVPVLSDFTPAQIDRGDVLSYLNQVAKNNSDSFTTNPSRRGTAGCSLSNLRIRREWRTLNKPERKSYIAAVKCLRTKPSLLDPVAFPGSKSLFDDFVAIHLVQTLNIHLSVSFSFTSTLSTSHAIAPNTHLSKRQPSSPGTDTSHTPTRKGFATTVAIQASLKFHVPPPSATTHNYMCQANSRLRNLQAPSPTGNGASTSTTQPHPPSLTAPIPLSAATGNTSPTRAWSSPNPSTPQPSSPSLPDPAAAA